MTCRESGQGFDDKLTTRLTERRMAMVEWRGKGAENTDGRDTLVGWEEATQFVGRTPDFARSSF